MQQMIYQLRTPPDVRDLIARIEAEQSDLMRNYEFPKNSVQLFFKLSPEIRAEIDIMCWSVPIVAGGRPVMEAWAKKLQQL